MSERPPLTPEFNTTEKPRELLAKEGVKDKESFLQYFEERGIFLEDEIEKRKEEILASQDMSLDKIESTIKNFRRIMLEYDKAAANKAAKAFDRLYAKLVDAQACNRVRDILNDQKKKLRAEEDKKPQPQKEEVVVAPLEKNSDTPPKIQEQTPENSGTLPAEEAKEPATPKEDPIVVPENLAHMPDDNFPVSQDEKQDLGEPVAEKITEAPSSKEQVAGSLREFFESNREHFPGKGEGLSETEKKDLNESMEKFLNEENNSNSLPEEKVKFVDFELTPSPDIPLREEDSVDEPQELSPQEKEDQEKFQFDPYGARHDHAVREHIKAEKRREARVAISPLKTLDKIQARYWQWVSAQEEKKYQVRNKASEERSYTPEERAQMVKEFQEGRPEPEFPSDEEKAFSRPIEHGPGVTPELSDIIQKIGEIQTRSQGRFPLSPLKVWDHIQRSDLERKRAEMEKIEGILAREKEAQELEKEREESGPKKVSEEEEQVIESTKQWHDAALHHAPQAEVLGESSQEVSTKEDRLELQENLVPQEEKNTSLSPEASQGEQQSGLKVGEEERQETENVLDDEAEAMRVIQELPKKEKEELKFGWSYAGYYAKERKSHYMIQLLSRLEGESVGGKFFKALADTYRNDQKEAREHIEKRDTEKFSKTKNTAMLAAGLVKWGRTVMEAAQLTGSPFRYGMMIAQGFTRTADAAKEARLNSEAVQEKTRMQDIEEAQEEAIRIYQRALQGAPGGNPTKAHLEKEYQERLPKDLLKRLGQQEGFTFTNLAQGFAQKILSIKIEHAKKKGKLDTPEMKRFLKDCDRMIGQYGTVDMFAMSAKMLEKTGKLAMLGMGGWSMYRTLEHFFPDIMHQMGEHIAPVRDELLSKFHGMGESATTHIPDKEIPHSLSLDRDTLGGASRNEIVPTPDSPSSIPQQPAGPTSPTPEISNLEKPNIEHVIKAPSILPATLEVDGVKMEIPEKPLSIGKHGPEGAIINHLVSHHPQEISREKAGWLAHRMFDRFMGTDEAKELMKTHGIKDKEGLMKLMTRIKEGNVEIDAKGNMHLRNISFLKAVASRVAEVASGAEPAPSLAALQEEFATPHLEPELKTMVNVPGADQDLYEGRTMILQDQGVPKEVIESLSKEDITNLKSADLKIYGERVQELSSLGVPPEDIANFPPRELIDEDNEHTNTVLANLRKPVLREAGIPDSVVEGMAHHDIRSLHTERIADTAANALSDLEFSEGRVVVQGGRVYAHDYRRGFIDTSKYLNPNYREVLKESGIKNIYFAETKIKDEARFLALYEKALKAFEGKPQARVIKKAIDQLIGGMEKQYGDVFKN